jgi:hypothetical protein
MAEDQDRQKIQWLLRRREWRRNSTQSDPFGSAELIDLGRRHERAGELTKSTTPCPWLTGCKYSCPNVILESEAVDPARLGAGRDLQAKQSASWSSALAADP